MLLDAVTRASYDARVQARLQRKKRDLESAADLRAMKSALQAREAEAVLAKLTKVDKAARLRDETAAYRSEKADRAARKEELAKKNEAIKATLPASFHIATVHVRWNATSHTYSQTELSRIVRPFGSVEGTFTDPKSPNQATIILSSETAAIALINGLHPESDKGREYGFTHVSLSQSSAKASTFASSSSFSSSSAPLTPSASPAPAASLLTDDMDDDELEAMTFAMMKGASKRSKLS